MVDKDWQLRADLRQALDGVTPDAPWLTSVVRDSLRARGRRGRYGLHSWAPAAAGAAVIVVAALVVALFVSMTVYRQVPRSSVPANPVRVAPTANPYVHISTFHLRGTLRDDSGRPVSGGTVSTGFPDNILLSTPNQSVLSGADGTYDIAISIPDAAGGFGAGLTARKLGFEDQEANFFRAADATIDFAMHPVIRLGPGSSVTLLVTATDSWCYASLDGGAPCRIVRITATADGLYTIDLAANGASNRLGLQFDGGVLWQRGSRPSILMAMGQYAQVDVLFLDRGNLTYLGPGIGQPTGTDAQEFTLTFQACSAAAPTCSP